MDKRQMMPPALRSRRGARYGARATSVPNYNQKNGNSRKRKLQPDSLVVDFERYDEKTIIADNDRFARHEGNDDAEDGHNNDEQCQFENGEENETRNMKIDHADENQQGDSDDDGDDVGAKKDDDADWKIRCEELAAYRQKFGNCKVSRAGPYASLSRWMDRQRQKYKLRKAGQESPLTDERVKMLESIKGFAWVPYVTWDTRFKELMDFHRRFGHAEVTDPKMKTWMYKQRSKCREGRLPSSQLERLNSIGFTWETNRTWASSDGEVLKPPPLVIAQNQHSSENNRMENEDDDHSESDDESEGSGVVMDLFDTLDNGDENARKKPSRRIKRSRKRSAEDDEDDDCSWERHAVELAAFRCTYGHCRIFRTDEKYKALSRWLVIQRHQYKRRAEGKSSTLTDERIKMLESIDGFAWSKKEEPTQNKCPPLWDVRFQELVAFQRQFGHFKVPSKNKTLHNWVTRQRARYRSGILDKSYIEQLESIGFVWNVSNGSKKGPVNGSTEAVLDSPDSAYAAAEYPAAVAQPIHISPIDNEPNHVTPPDRRPPVENFDFDPYSCAFACAPNTDEVYGPV